MARILKSSKCSDPSYVVFVNKTQRNVNLFWVDYNGKAIFYVTLFPGNTYKVNTFRHHPWIFREARTGKRMHVNHKDTFWPEQYYMRSPQNSQQRLVCRKQIIIHWPVVSLRHACLWKVLRIIMEAKKNVHEEGKVLKKLPLPRTLTADLAELLQVRIDHGCITNGADTRRM